MCVCVCDYGLLVYVGMCTQPQRHGLHDQNSWRGKKKNIYATRIALAGLITELIVIVFTYQQKLSCYELVFALREEHSVLLYV